MRGERSGDRRRLIFATLFALAMGLLVYTTNPADRIRAEVRADAKGFVLSLEYSVKLFKARI